MTVDLKEVTGLVVLVPGQDKEKDIKFISLSEMRDEDNESHFISHPEH